MATGVACPSQQIHIKSMVNRNVRIKAAALILQLISGEITNDDFEGQFPTEDSDSALKPIYRRLWQFWDDRSTHTLSGQRALGTEARELCNRCVAFLQSTLEYEWPSIAVEPPVTLILSRVFRLPRNAATIENTIHERLASFGDFDVWPFRRRADYEKALKTESHEPETE